MFISSLSGKAASPGGSLYSATKFGCAAFALGLREDLEGTGVGVTTVFPGFIRDAGMFHESGAELPHGRGHPHAGAGGRGACSWASSADSPRSTWRRCRCGRRRWRRDRAGTDDALQRRLGSRDIAAQMAEGQAYKR